MAKKTLDRKQLGQHLQELRVRLGYSLVSLSSITGVSPATISRMENGSQITLNKLELVCRVLGITLEELSKKSYINISTEQFHANIKKQIRKLPLSSAAYKTINEKAQKFHGPSYLVKMSIEDGYLNQYREVREVQEHIQSKYDTRIVSSIITNALKRNKQIVYAPSERTNYLKYKSAKEKTARKKRTE